MKSLLVLYFTCATLYYLYCRFFSHKYEGLNEWVPREYRKEFLDSSEITDILFDKGEEIPGDSPTLLIVGNVRIKDKGVSILDLLAKLLTFGRLRFNEIIPVGKPVSLRFYLKNISEGNFCIQGRNTTYYIKYPGETKPSRKWRIEIPNLNNKGDCCSINSELFFCPEVPGTHELWINGLQDLVYAGPYGMSGRKYRIPRPGASWLFRFHVSSGYEYRVFLVAFFALVVAIISLILTLLV